MSGVLSQLRGLKGIRPEVVFSGIQPTGIPHLGNHVGALRQWVRLQKDMPQAKLIYSVVNLHAFTTPQQRDQLERWSKESLAAILAVGVDPQRCTVFVQSDVPEHLELMWLLSCTASMGYLSRMTQWKTKLNMPAEEAANSDAGSFQSAASQSKLGLFSYPVLQAADILVHRATHVPVGDDQRQHLEFARECVTNFNHAHGPVLVEPETMTASAPRIMSLTDPTAKMSKSAKSSRSRILITDEPLVIEKKIRGAITDSERGITYDRVGRPGIANLLDILAAFDTAERSSEELAKQYHELSPKHFKDLVAQAVISGLDGVRERYTRLIDDERYLQKVGAEGARRARKSAEETMALVREATGMKGFVRD